MTIDEAIKHCEEVAWENDRKAMCVEEAYQTTEQQNCEQCASDHRQLAAWLRDLRQAKAIILDMSYTLEVLCDKVNAEIGCSKCPYSDGGCRVKSWLTRQRDFCKAELIGGKDNDS